MKNSGNSFLSLCLSVMTLLLPACSVAPSEGTIRDMIKNHFESRRYRVIDLQLGDASSVPLGEQRYMGTKGYQIEIRKIILETTEDRGFPMVSRKGERLTFENCGVRIRESADRKGTWVIVSISGIIVP